jgi:toxin ParE1/3/4
VACRLTWTEGATADVDDHAHYLSQYSHETAAWFVRVINDAAERLRDFPLSGRMVPEWRHRGRREIIVKNHRLIYRVEENEVVIVAVEGARQILPSWYSSSEP